MSEDFFDFLSNPELTALLDSGVVEEKPRTKSSPWFECLGEASAKRVQVHGSGYLESGEVDWILGRSRLSGSKEDLDVFGQIWDRGALPLYVGVFTGKMCKAVQELEACARLKQGKKDLALRRRWIVSTLLYFREYAYSLQDKKYDWLLEELLPVVYGSVAALNRCCDASKLQPFCDSAGNKSLHPSYHFFHSHLDIRWLHVSLLLVLLQTRKLSSSEINPSVETLESDLAQATQDLTQDLFKIGVAHFDSTKTPFPCTCVQEMWVLLLVLSDMTEASRCWGTLNESLISATPLCSLWFLYHISRLEDFKMTTYGTQGNHEKGILEMLLRQGITEDTKEAEMRHILPFAEKLAKDTNSILILWEYFHKRINSGFHMPGSVQDSLTVLSRSSLSLISWVKELLDGSQSPANSFHHFLRILGVHLQTATNVRTWNVVKGRLYSKLSGGRISTLSPTGIINFLNLFLVLALTAPISQIEEKMLELHRQCGISVNLVRGVMAFALLLAERNLDVSRILGGLVASMNRVPVAESREVFSLFIESVQDLLDASSSLTLGQHVVVDSWIEAYWRSADPSECSRLTDLIVSLVTKLRYAVDLQRQVDQVDQSTIIIIEKLWDQLQGFLSSSSELPLQVGDLSANLGIVFVKQGNHQRFQEICKAMNDIPDVLLVRRFYVILIGHDWLRETIPDFTRTLAKVWLRSSMVSPEGSEMTQLTQSVAREMELSGDRGDPFLNFLDSMRSKYSSSKDIYEKQKVREKVNGYFEGVEAWIRPVLNPPKDPELVQRVYFTCGCLVERIPNLLYVKSKPNSLLKTLLDFLLLPASVRNEEFKLHPNILAAVRSSLHLYLEGLVSLGGQNDHYILRCLKELLTAYLPRCTKPTVTLQGSFIPSFGLISSFSHLSSEARKSMLELACTTFIKKKSRTPHPQTSCAIRFVREILSTHKANYEVLLSILETVLERLCDVVMFCEEKTPVHNSAKDSICLILDNSMLGANDEAKDEVVSVLSNLAQENLAWSSKQLFDLVLWISTLAPDIVLRFMPQFLEYVRQVEVKRGVGYDRVLRMGLERVQSSLRTVRQS